MGLGPVPVWRRRKVVPCRGNSSTYSCHRPRATWNEVDLYVCCGSLAMGCVAEALVCFVVAEDQPSINWERTSSVSSSCSVVVTVVNVRCVCSLFECCCFGYRCRVCVGRVAETMVVVFAGVCCCFVLLFLCAARERQDGRNTRCCCQHSQKNTTHCAVLVA